MSKLFEQQVHRISCRVCDTRRSEIEHLTAGGITSYKSLVRATLNQERDKETRRIGAWVLGRLPARKSGLRAILTLLKDNDVEVAAKAANSAGRLKYKKAVPELVAMLDSPHEKQCLAALAALGEIRGREAARALLSVMESEDVTRRWEAAKLLPVFSGKKITGKLIRLLKNHQGPVREVAAYALGFKGDAEAIKPLLLLVQDEDELDVVRAHALDAIGYLAPGCSSVAKKLVDFLRNPKIVMRFWTACALARVATPDNKKVIAELERLEHDNALLTYWWTVAEEAKYALDCIYNRDTPDREWLDESFPASLTELELPTGDSIARNGETETLTLVNGDTLVTSQDQEYKFNSGEEFVIHTQQPHDTTIIEYKNGDNIAFNQTGVVQLLRGGRNMRVKRD